MQSIFSVARQLGDEFVRVLDDLAAEEDYYSPPGATSSSRGVSEQHTQLERDLPPSSQLGGHKSRPKHGPPMALVQALQAQLGIGIIALTTQNQLNILIQYFTAPMTTTTGSVHHFSACNKSNTGAVGGPEQIVDLAEERIFLFHLFLQLNYLHEADWVTSLSALVPQYGQGGDTGDVGFSGHTERCLKFPYLLDPTKPPPPTVPTSQATPQAHLVALATTSGAGIPNELIVVRPCLTDDTMRRMYRWVAMFYMERALMEEKLQEMHFQRMQQQSGGRGIDGGSSSRSGVPPPDPTAIHSKAPPHINNNRWSVGCSFHGHRNGAKHLVNGCPVENTTAGASAGAGGFDDEEEISGEDQEPQPNRGRGDRQCADYRDHYDSSLLLPNESFTLTMMGEDVNHRHLLLTQCQRHRLFRDTTPQLLWASHEARYNLWDVLPSSGTKSPVVLVLQSQDLDVFGCILSSMPATREHKKEYELGEGAMPFLSFFTFTPTFQFLDVEAPTMVPFDDESEKEVQDPVPVGSSPPEIAVPKLSLLSKAPTGGFGGSSSTQAGGTSSDPGQQGLGSQQGEEEEEESAFQTIQNTAAYFMSLGEGDPPSLGRLQSSQRAQSVDHTLQQAAAAKSTAQQHDDSEKAHARHHGGDDIRREVSEVALSVDRRDEGGLTVCARFNVPGSSSSGGGGAQQMMVVVLDIAQSLSECRVAAKSASAELHSGFHFNVTGKNKNTASSPTSASSNKAGGGASVDNLAILEDDRRSVPLRAVEVYHMDLAPSLHHPGEGTMPVGSPDAGRVREGEAKIGTLGPTEAPPSMMQRAYSEAPPFVIHPESPPGHEKKKRDTERNNLKVAGETDVLSYTQQQLGGRSQQASPCEEDCWDDAERVPSPVPVQPYAHPRADSTDDFIVI